MAHIKTTKREFPYDGGPGRLFLNRMMASEAVRVKSTEV